ncbi:MAG: ABC transporter ATP-binding protein [Rhodospirillales bacterium]|nr:ABC transporter ATP-binding protein [Rhodospirillales bacterium]
MGECAIELKGIERTYAQGNAQLKVLCGASLAVKPGEIVALLGPSGSGKSTLLHIAGLLEQVPEGEILIDGQSCSGMTDMERTLIRRAKLGFVYQFHHLLPEFSALENVMVPQMIAGRSRAKATAGAMDLLRDMGLADRASHRPARLSGGEQQRVAIARAVANNPAVLLADEPTGNLDQETAERVLAALLKLVRERGLAALVATHNAELAKTMDRQLRIEHGLVVAA